KAQLFRNSSMLQRWSQSFVEDVQVQHATRELGLQIRHAPVLMVNREKIDLPSCCRFITRQMVSVRLYHESCNALVAYAVLSTAAVVAGIGLSIASFWSGDAIIAFAALGGIFTYGAGLTALVAWMESTVRRTIRARGESLERLPLR